MQYSEKFGFFLPSRDVGDYADINQISYNFRVIDENVPQKNEVSQAIDMKTDQVFNRYSPNAQSGVAVKEALDIFANEYVENAIGARIYSSTDKEYSPTSENAQSGIAVAEALLGVSGGGKGTLTTICDITLTEEVNSVICADINSFADISKVGDFYMFVQLPKHDIKQNGNMLVRINTNSVFGVVGNFDSANDYDIWWKGYSINIPNSDRFSLIHSQFMRNGTSTSLNVRSTCSVIAEPLNKIHIELSDKTAVLPIGTKIKIEGWVQ